MNIVDMNDVDTPKKEIPTVELVWQTILSCPHSITKDEIVLKSDGSGKNVANELWVRLQKIFQN